MRIIARRALREFWTRHRDAEQQLKAWFSETRKAQWRGPSDVRDRYATASFVAPDRVVFNICGNRYRLVVAVRYDPGLVFIRFVGTHRQYDNIDVSSI
jgi:mRNA interferase HigB